MFAHVILLLVLATSLDAYSSGAPPSGCAQLAPKHPGQAAQNGQTFYAFVPSATRVGQGSTVSLAITSSNSQQQSPFQGFMVQARNPLAPNEPLGTFDNPPKEAKTVDCPPSTKNTLTQVDKSTKTYVEVEWTPPADYIGTVVFNGTILQDFTTFWAGIQSEPVQIVKRSLLGDGGASTGISTTRRPKITTTTPPPTLRPDVASTDSLSRNAMISGCGVGSKTCFGMPAGCYQSNSCNILVTVDHDSTAMYTFEMFAQQYQSGDTYVALGLSSDEKMGTDSVVHCMNVGGAVKFGSSWNFGQKNQPDNSLSVQMTNSSVTNGNVYCKFTRPPSTTHQNINFDLDATSYYLLIARGPVNSPGSVGYHGTEKLSTAEALLLFQASAPMSASKLLLRLHAGFMIAAWIGSASLGILLARYFKQTWVGSQLCGKDQWFAWHRMFMLLTWTLTIVAFVLIFVELKAWSSANNPHAILGTCTTILAFIQPFMAALRPDPSSPKRPIFNWMHWLVGNAAHILAIVSIFFATKLSKAEVPAWLDWIIVAYVAFHVLMHLTFSIIGCNSEKNSGKRVSTFAMKDMSSNRNPLGAAAVRNQDAPHSTLRKALLGIYIVVILLLTIAIVVVAVMAPIEESYQKLKDIVMP